MFEAHRLLYHSTLGLRLIKKKKIRKPEGDKGRRRVAPRKYHCHGTEGPSRGVSTTPDGRGIFLTLWFNSVRGTTKKSTGKLTSSPFILRGSYYLTLS